MKNNASRRKFLATAISGTVASVVAPVAFAGEKTAQVMGQSIGNARKIDRGKSWKSIIGRF